MMALVTAIFGSAILRTVAISLLGAAISMGGMAWLRYSARAPYQAQVVELKDIIKKRDATVDADRKLAEAEAQRAEGLKDDLSKLSTLVGSCKLSAVELSKLRKLSGTDKH